MGTGQMDISSPEKLIIANRRRRVVEMRRDGLSLEAIADVIRSEFESPSYCKQRSHDDLMAALSKSNKLTATEIVAYRKIEELRLDFMWSKLVPAMSQGEVKAIDSGVKLCRAKSQLLGLDAATQTIVENSVKQELNSVLDQLQVSFDAPTYRLILGVIAGRDEGFEESEEN